ncbi:type II toxin-antitoxin system PemK/MazF family toxin [Clostridium taeniosporum]|uniref:Type II toxin-antitoxin system PemK/MazF family toxin n=1 Tax=Clostridium taeniosporum TaxID=394958 RepID=A0A1D7XMQ6_9CLOT|nr:type II toxin-antitoxin system PemK/MazF family toxin [Clostridium taeniosporum]AOR24594.1 type II toxin-antitoxin system PemK/MazF family toxin [Clostridium taeniosporum]
MQYNPKQGDIIFLTFDPQVGHEQRGRRLALVVSNNTFNSFTSIAVVCPITNTNRYIPIHVPLDERTKTTGVVMCDQVKSLDIKMRNAEFVERVPQDILAEVIDIIVGFVEFE